MSPVYVCENVSEQHSFNLLCGPTNSFSSMTNSQNGSKCQFILSPAAPKSSHFPHIPVKPDDIRHYFLLIK